MNMRTLTADQQARWAIDGYLHLEEVFDHEEVCLLYTSPSPRD